MEEATGLAPRISLVSRSCTRKVVSSSVPCVGFGSSQPGRFRDDTGAHPATQGRDVTSGQRAKFRLAPSSPLQLLPNAW